MFKSAGSRLPMMRGQRRKFLEFEKFKHNVVTDDAFL
jgi:hypothetical protein